MSAGRREPERMLVVGGTGTLGRHVVAGLLAGGHPVRVTTRAPANAGELRSRGAEIVQADLRDQTTLEHACRRVGVVVAAAHSIMGRGPAASGHVDGEGHRRLMDVAREHGVRHVVYVSVFSGDPAFDAIPFLRLKREVEAHVRTSGLSWTIVRPTAFMDFHAHVLIGAPVLAGKRVVVFGRGDRPRNFVAAADVSHVVVRAAVDAALAHQVIEIGGPENLTTMDVVAAYERAVGRRARVSHVPLGVVRAASALLGPIHPGLSQVLQMTAVTERLGQPFDAAPIAERLGLGLTRLDDWIASRLRERQRPAAP